MTLIAVLVAVAGAALIFSSTAGAAGTSPLEVRYAKVREICPHARPHGARCMGLRLVPARKNAPGARAYVLAAGARSKGPAGGLTPADLASAYGFVASAGGSEQTVALVDAFDDPDIEADLGTFDSQYGLPACTSENGCFTKVSQTGSTTELPEGEPGWALEISLDVETVHSVCPNCKILLVEANSESTSDLAAAVDEAVALGATEVSNSYGFLESELGASEAAAYNHPGVVITASAGDSGWDDWDYAFEFAFEEEEPPVAPGEPDAPASLPSVVAVGGTSLRLTSKGTRKSETVWNDSGPPADDFKKFKRLSATGSGCSTLFTAPSWQEDAEGWASTGCGDKRLDNDIAADADPYTGFDLYDSYSGSEEAGLGWITIGGTSLSSPLVSALYALAGGSHGVSYPAATLYEHLGQASALYDVTEGGSGYCDGEAEGPCGEPKVNEEYGPVDCLGTSACDAAVGFDGPSGVGAPIGLVAFGGPSQAKATVVTEPASSLTASSATLNATVDPNGATVTQCSFEWGTTTAYGQSVPCSPPPGSGTSPEAVSATITGLSARTAYHFRISATTVGGTSLGKGKRLKTPR